MSRVYGLSTFPAPYDAKQVDGPFRNNILYLLGECADKQQTSINGLKVWLIQLVHNASHFSFYIFEDHTKHHCDHCRLSGWTNHLITKRSYHLIISPGNDPLDSQIFISKTNLLYGLIHCNGFGHLLYINEREDESEFPFAEEIMDLWDRICTYLHTRKITAQDSFINKGMPVRLLRQVAYGPWFGTWGYQFCEGSSEGAEYDHTVSIEFLRSIELKDLSSWDTDIHKVIYWYKNLDSSLNNFGDLLKFMLTSRDLLARSSATDAAPPCCSGSLAKTRLQEYKDRWPKEKLKKMVQFAKLFVGELSKRKAENGACIPVITSQQIGKAAYGYLRDTALAEDVLTLLNNGIVGDYIVSSDVNLQTHAKEYTVRKVKPTDQGVDLLALAEVKQPAIVPGNDVSSDISYLYNALRDCRYSKMVELAVKTISDTNIFVKDWPLVQKSGMLLNLLCGVTPATKELEVNFTAGYPPPEHIVVSQYSTIEELKVAVQNAMRDTYYIMDRITVTELEGKAVRDEELLFDALESELRFKVIDIAFENELMKKGTMAKCNCGVNNLDGERMEESDKSEVWQPTGCSGIGVTKKDSVCRSCLSLKR